MVENVFLYKLLRQAVAVQPFPCPKGTSQSPRLFGAIFLPHESSSWTTPIGILASSARQYSTQKCTAIKQVCQESLYYLIVNMKSRISNSVLYHCHPEQSSLCYNVHTYRTEENVWKSLFPLVSDNVNHLTGKIPHHLKMLSLTTGVDMASSGTEQFIQRPRNDLHPLFSPFCHTSLWHSTQVSFIPIWELYKSQENSLCPDSQMSVRYLCVVLAHIALIQREFVFSGQ